MSGIGATAPVKLEVTGVVCWSPCPVCGRRTTPIRDGQRVNPVRPDFHCTCGWRGERPALVEKHPDRETQAGIERMAILLAELGRLTETLDVKET